MWQEGKSGNPSGRPKTGNTFKDYCEKWNKKIKKEITTDDGKTHRVTAKECSVIAIFKMIQNDETPPLIKLQAIKLMLEYTEGKPQPEVISNVNIQNVQQASKNYLDDVKNSLDKLTPQERDEYFKICEKLNNADNQ